MKNPMSSVEVQRESRSWSDYLRSYKVIIDGREVGKIYAGGSYDAEVHPGSHEVFLKIDWCRSEKIDVDLAPGETAKFLCGPRSNPLASFYWMIFDRHRYLALVRVTGM